MDYMEFTFELEPVQPYAEIMMAELADLGFESFMETPNGLQAWLPIDQFSPFLVERLGQVNLVGLDRMVFTNTLVEDRNWNAQWEAAFEPIVVPGFCCVRAPFHAAEDGLLDLIIEPKMSFGTGHHATTRLMLEQIGQRNLDLAGKHVLDMGCGTSVLGIAVAKCGASRVLCVDIEDWACANSVENIARNNVEAEVRKGGAEMLDEETFDLILANINRNILMRDLPNYAAVLRPGGELLLSGFFTTDAPGMLAAAAAMGLEPNSTHAHDGWCCLVLSKPDSLEAQP
jgi:ribosomal protein L11 methyltransferase